MAVKGIFPFSIRAERYPVFVLIEVLELANLLLGDSELRQTFDEFFKFTVSVDLEPTNFSGSDEQLDFEGHDTKESEFCWENLMDLKIDFNIRIEAMRLLFFWQPIF